VSNGLPDSNAKFFELLQYPSVITTIANKIAAVTLDGAEVTCLIVPCVSAEITLSNQNRGKTFQKAASRMAFSYQRTARRGDFKAYQRPCIAIRA